MCVYCVTYNVSYSVAYSVSSFSLSTPSHNTSLLLHKPIKKTEQALLNLRLDELDKADALRKKERKEERGEENQGIKPIKGVTSPSSQVRIINKKKEGRKKKEGSFNRV